MNQIALQDRMLSAFRPEHGEAPPIRWQQRKSAQTRLKLIEAGIDCLIEGGYTGLTTASVAERCGVSRGAMHHHFATRLELVSAVVEHVFYRRMRAFLEDYFAALRQRGEESMVEVACEAHWRSVQTRDYAAYLELAVAARTDAELDGQFTPAARRYDDVWTSEMIEAMPQLRQHWESMKLASDFALAIDMGLLLHRPVFTGEDGSEGRIERLRGLVFRTVQMLYRESGEA